MKGKKRDAESGMWPKALSECRKHWTYLGELGSVVEVVKMKEKMIVIWAPD
jgi:hypothetical protein